MQTVIFRLPYLLLYKVEQTKSKHEDVEPLKRDQVMHTLLCIT